MKQRIGLALFILLFLIQLRAVAPADKSCLWRIETPNGDCYLLGSVHMLKKESYPLKKNIEDAFAQSMSIAVEMDLSQDKLMQMGMKMMQKGIYQGSESLIDAISPKTYDLVNEGMKKMDLDIAQFTKFKPWMLASLILSKKLMNMGFDANFGVDIYFLNKAADKKEILELEGFDFQMNLFEGLTRAENEGFLLSTILESEKMDGEMDKIVKAWTDGDLLVLEKLLTEDMKKYPELENFNKKLVDDRNMRMADQAASYIKAGKKFFLIVGALHMVGKNGIVQLLRDKGYTVTQL